MIPPNRFFVVFLVALASRTAIAQPPIPTLDDNAVVELLAENNLQSYMYSARCFERPAELPGVVVIGVYVNEVSRCAIVGVVVGGRYGRINEMIAEEMIMATFPSLTEPERIEFALRWLRLVAYRFEPMLEQAPPEFSEPHMPAFAPVETETRPDGTILVRAWTDQSVNRGRHAFEHREHVFGIDGTYRADDLVRVQVSP